MLAKAFDSVEAASQSGGLSPIQFSTLWRSLSGERQNLFAEMKMFHKFNASGSSVVDFEASNRLMFYVFVGTASKIAPLVL